MTQNENNKNKMKKKKKKSKTAIKKMARWGKKKQKKKRFENQENKHQLDVLPKAFDLFFSFGLCCDNFFFFFFLLLVGYISYLILSFLF